MKKSPVLLPNEYAITYLGHSGWSIEAAEFIIIFDYSIDAPGHEENSSLIKNVLSSNREKPIYIFASHDHEDHFHKDIFDYGNIYPHIHYILGWPYAQAADLSPLRIHCLQPGETFTEGELEILTIPATDDGSAFFVTIKDFTFCHLGDHGNWVPELTEEFCQLLSPFVIKNRCPDALFLPVLKGSGARPESMTFGGQRCIEMFSPSHVFPMHGGGREALYEDFRKDMDIFGLGENIHCALNVGDQWIFTKNSLQNRQNKKGASMLPLKNFPELDTKRLRLRGLTPEDKEDIFEMQSDPKMCEHTDSRPETEISGTIAYIERMTGGIQEGKWLLWGLEEKSTEKIIGTICLWNFSPAHKMAELGYGLLPSYQGKGLMKEALNAVATFSFETLHLKALDAYTEENNHPSIRLLTSCGFSEVDRVTDEGFYVDRDLNMVVFRLEK